jgi:polyisoprenoid-binding protein YceI
MFFRPLPTTIGIVAILLCSSPTTIAATIAKVDPAHTSATFSVRHLTLTTVSGTIALKNVDIAIGDDDILTQANATFDLSTIDTHESDRDSDLKSDHWFDVAHYPEMTFKSTKIDAGTGGAMAIAGDLTFHGITKPVTLAGKYEGSVKDGRGRTHLGYSASGTVDRTAWNLGPNFPPAVVGDDITITIELEAIES